MDILCFCKLLVALHSFVCNQSKRNFTNRLVLKEIYLNIILFEFYSLQSNELIGIGKITYDYERGCVTLFVCEEEENNKTLFCKMADEYRTYIFR